MSDWTNAAGETLRDRRETPRVRGPFVGRRLGALTMDLRVHDLSLGGCLIESFHEASPGRRLRIQIDLPGEDSLILDAETLYNRTDYGFAVKFIDPSAAALATLARVIDRLKGDSLLTD
jgi:hypothetical protein